MDVSGEVKVGKYIASCSGWHVVYDKVAFSHHCCSCRF